MRSTSYEPILLGLTDPPPDRKQAQSVQGLGSESGVGQRYRLRLDLRGLALSGHPPRPLLAPVIGWAMAARLTWDLVQNARTRELIYHRRYRSGDEITQDIFEYIEALQPRLRRHSTVGSHSTIELEARAAWA